MHSSEHRAAIEADVTRIAELLRDADLTTRVDHLNRWKIRDVVAHLGGVHRWATRIVAERSMAGPGFTKSKLDGTDLCDWFDDGAAALMQELDKQDPADACPNFNPGSDRNIGWWIRRQAHETAVHRWDIERSLDSTTPIRAALAADGIDEFVDVFVRRRGKQTLASTLVVQTTRPKCQWTLTPAEKPGRIDVEPGPPSPDTAHEVTLVSGQPGPLLLALWGRISATEAKLTIDGDQTAAAAMLTLDQL